MSNKIHGFIQKVFRNSKLNRENLKYSFHKIITRRNHTFIKIPFSFEIFGTGEGGGGGGGGHKPSSLLFILIITSIGIYNNQTK